MAKKIDDTPAESGEPAVPISGVTQENFMAHGLAFMRRNGGKGFLIVRDIEGHRRVPRHAGEPEYPATPRQWGAWMAWYSAKFGGRSIDKGTGGIMAITKQGYGTVPAEWPHLFDAEWRQEWDEEAASRWMITRRYHTGYPPHSTPFRPFPKLWAAFADEPEIIKILDHAPSFEFLDRAGRVYAMRGKDAARGVISP